MWIWLAGLGCSGPDPIGPPPPTETASDTGSDTASDPSVPELLGWPACVALEQAHVFTDPLATTLTHAVPTPAGATLTLWEWSTHRSRFVDLAPDGTLTPAGDLASDGADSTFRMVGGLADGGRVVAGSFRGTVVLDPGGPTEQALTAGVDPHVALVREAPDGSVAWARQLGGAKGGTRLRDAVTLDDGGVIVALETWEPLLVLGAGEAGEAHIVLPQGEDTMELLARYTAVGTLAWAVPLGGHDTSEYRLVHDSVTDRVTVTAEVQRDAPDAGWWAQITQLDGSGVLRWQATVKSTHTWPRGLATGPDGDVFVAGTFQNDVTLVAPSGAEHVEEEYLGRYGWLARLDASGELRWWLDTTAREGAGWEVQSFALANDGSSLLWVGHTLGSVRFGDGDMGWDLPRKQGAVFLAVVGLDGELDCVARIPVSPDGKSMYVTTAFAEGPGRWLLAGTLDGPASATVGEGSDMERTLASETDNGWVVRVAR